MDSPGAAQKNKKKNKKNQLPKRTLWDENAETRQRQIRESPANR